MIAARRPRWALSFADMCLLLLGFFVLLHARGGDGRAVADGLRTAFGGAPGAAAPASYRAEHLFEPGQAVFRPGQTAHFRAIAARAGARGTVVIESRGADQPTRRFDAWELAAARAAAVARAIHAAGIDESRIAIVVPPPRAGDAGAGQTLRIAVRPAR